MLSNKVYDILKFIAQYALPAIATLYFGLAKIWNLPYPEQIMGSILAIDAFLGAILGINLAKYNKQMAHMSGYMQEVVQSTQPKNVLTMSNSVYDILYWIAQVVVPALGALYFALNSLWALPYGEQIVGTLALIDAVLGIFLGISTSQYNKFTSGSPV